MVESADHFAVEFSYISHHLQPSLLQLFLLFNMSLQSKETKASYRHRYEGDPKGIMRGICASGPNPSRTISGLLEQKTTEMLDDSYDCSVLKHKFCYWHFVDSI